MSGVADAANRYDPRLRFRTLTTPRFDIHFHQGEDDLARRLADIAETAATELEPKLGRPSGRVHVILVNQDDLSNGWAAPLPFNVIEIVAASPRGSSVIGNTSDWLRLVFVHEYTHILHLDRSRGLFGGLRRVFGRHPVLFPNIFTPLWQIEGIATYFESATGEGRLPAADFRIMLRRAATAKHISLDRASSVRVDWPWGNTPYLYGGYFHDYLAKTYGEDSLRKLADATAGRIPYLGSGAFKRVYGRSLGELWNEFERASAREADTSRNLASRLTRHGFVVSAPAYSPGGRLFYGIATPHRFPALMEHSADGDVRQVTTRVAGGRISAGERAIVFDQVEYVRSIAVQSDLYLADADTGEVRRLTREARAGDPDVSPDGRTIVCAVQEADRRWLATLPADGGGAISPMISEPDTNYASPRWSPDGRSIVAERQRLGAAPEIVLIDVATRQVTRTISGRGRSTTPSWMPDGTGVLFAAERDGALQIFRADVSSADVHRLVNAGDNGQWPVVSPDGRTLAFVGSTSEGYDLFSIGWQAAEWEPSPASVGSAERADPGTRSTTASVGPYRPARHLLPRFWTPIIESDADEVSFGAATAGSDALGRQAYAAGAAWSTSGRPDWYGAYIYDRWRAALFADTSLDTDSWLSGEIRTRQLNAGAQIPFRTFRRTQSLFAAFHLSNERFECAACEPSIDATIDRRALRGGWLFRSAKEYGYSISQEDGVIGSLASEWAPEGLGSSGDSSTLTADLRAFLPARPRHAVLALRIAGAASWGDEDAVRVFGIGGPGPRAAGASFDRDAIALVRGFDDDDVVGRRAAVVNADYRVPLAWIERGAGSWPVLLQSLHAAVFADAGAAWNERLSRRDRRASAGVELAANVVVGYAAPLTFAAGVAWRHDPTGSERGPALFARIGRGF